MFDLAAAHAPRMRRATLARGSRGFTLIEILVATVVLVALVGGMIAVLTGATAMWRDHETRRDAQSRVLSVLDQISADIQSIATNTSAEPQAVGVPVGGRPNRVRLLFGEDTLGRHYLVLTRHIGGDDTRVLPPRRAGVLQGTGVSPNQYFTADSDVLPDQIRPLENLAEVVYTFGPALRYRVELPGGRTFIGERIAPKALGALARDSRVQAEGGTTYYRVGEEIIPVRDDQIGLLSRPRLLDWGLYRGYVAPPPLRYRGVVGGPPSMFAAFDINAQRRYRDAFARDGLSGLQTEMARLWLDYLEPVANGVLWVGFQVWNPRTSQWVPSMDTVRDALADPFLFDSAAGRPISSLRTMRVTVTVMPLRGRPTRSTLSAPFNRGDSSLQLATDFALPSPGSDHPYLLIGDETVGALEWVRYGSVSGGTVGGITRGARSSRIHDDVFPAGTVVRWGPTSERIFDIPSLQEMPSSTGAVAAPTTLPNQGARP